jgi:cephalosporin hydroxylase
MNLQHLRIADVDAFNAYIQQRGLSGEDGAELRFSGAAVLYHSWKPGFLELTPAQLDVVKQLRVNGRDASASTAAVARELDSLGWLDADQPNLDELVERTKDGFLALQNPHELRRFLEIVREQQPRVVIEIGTAAGGMLYCLAQLAHPEALLISIDYPGGPYGGGQTDSEATLYRSFAAPGQHVAFVRDRSFHLSSLEDVKRLLQGRPVDLLFIDGDHSYGAVRSDFDMYGPLVGPGGISAFHDIVLEPETWGRGADSGVAWRTLKHGRRVQEIFDPSASRLPPAVRPRTYDEMARHAWGIGVIHH